MIQFFSAKDSLQGICRNDSKWKKYQRMPQRNLAVNMYEACWHKYNCKLFQYGLIDDLTFPCNSVAKVNDKCLFKYLNWVQ